VSGDGNDVGGDKDSGEVPNNAHVKQFNTLRFFDSKIVTSCADNGNIILCKNSLDAKM